MASDRKIRHFDANSPLEVSIDRDFARFGGKSYAINKINTVEVNAHRPYSRNAHFAWGLLAVIFFFSAIGGSGEPEGGGSSLLFVLAAVSTFLAWWTWQRAKIVEYQLMLATSSGSVHAVKSRDQDFIFGTRSQLERAIAGKLDQ